MYNRTKRNDCKTHAYLAEEVVISLELKYQCIDGLGFPMALHVIVIFSLKSLVKL